MSNRKWLFLAVLTAALGIGTACGDDDDDNDNDDGSADADTDTDTDGDADWSCDPDFYGSEDGCDCGCTIADPDCEGGGCTEPGCTDETCEYCYDGEGEELPCVEVPDEWTCDPLFYSDGDCDCGCTVADPDCGGGGCIVPDCIEETCEFCWGEVNDGECGGE